MRKGHGSTKVPGVKLRPAALTKPSSSSTLEQSAWAQPVGTDDIDTSEILKSCKKPFIGVVICASGVSDKINLFQQAIHLGAQTSSDLTDRVTHLICEGSGSKKYVYCVEHGIPVMQPSWINDSYVKWLSGEHVGVDSSVDDHRLPAFKSVRLCLTAIDDVQKRKRIHKLLEKNGGTYLDALGKNSHPTHLLCGPDRGKNVDERDFTPKMQFVDKANKTNVEKVSLVWEDWFWDCLEFKGLLSEKDYSVNGPRLQRRALREVSLLMAPITSTAEPLTAQTSTPPSVANTELVSKADVEELAAVRRLPETTARLWEGLLKKRGFEMKSGKLSRSPFKTQAVGPAFKPSYRKGTRSPSPLSARTAPPKSDSARASILETESSLSAAFKRTKSFAVKTAQSENLQSSLQRIRSTSASVFTSSTSSSFIAPNTSSLAPIDNKVPEGEKNLFVGLRFRALGDADGPKLTRAVELRGGIVIKESEGNVDFFIVRLASGSAFYQKEQSEIERSKYRTECWIEQCIFEERICAIEEHPAFVPLRITTPVPGAEKLNIHLSGLPTSEKTLSTRLIKAIGATVTDQLSRRNTHLLCPCGSGTKFRKAQQWRIPVVNLQWLYATVKAGEVQSIFYYLVASTSVPEMATEGGIADITNNEFAQGSSKSKPAETTSSRHLDPSTASLPAQMSRTESDTSQPWESNGLLSESVDQPPPLSFSISPRKMSALSISTHPSTRSPRRQITTEESMNDASGSPSKKGQANRLMRIPSSTTPSPLKIPINYDKAAASPSSLSGESANVLKDAITSLLGKRQSSDNNDALAQPGRNGKRSKPPPRSKSKQGPFSRTISFGHLTRHSSTTSDYPLFVSETIVTTLEPEAVDESMRVTYEDPSQRDEKRKLLSLINNEPVEPEPQEKPRLAVRKGRNLVRRTSRTAGS